MGGKIKIREATLSDALIIEKIIKAAFEGYSKFLPYLPDALVETVEDVEADIRTKLVFVVELNGDIVGTVRLTPCNGSVYLSRFAVIPTAQHFGLGKSILEYADIIAKNNGCNEIYLHTAKAAQRLINLYSSVGYEIVEITTDRGYERAKLIKKL